MVTWKNLDTLESYQELKNTARVNLKEVMSGENGAERVKKYSVPMAEGMAYNYAAKAVDDQVLEALAKLAKEAQLTEKFAALYNGEVINTGEKRLVLHHLTRGQLGDKVEADGVDKREFYLEQQKKVTEFANKVHAGEITNAAGEKFTTVVQIGIGGSDLGPRAMYLALENWAKKNGTFKMEAKFISNVDPDDAAAVLASIDVAHSLFVLVSKSGTTLETLTNESFVKDAIPPHPQWAGPYCPWPSDRRCSNASWQARPQRTSWRRRKIFWRIRLCWMPSSAYMSGTCWRWDAQPYFLTPRP